ncbi:hypothetical protein FKM82_009837 [Ascaphus truei]
MLWPSGNKSVSVEKRQRERIPSAEHVLYQIFNMVKKGEKGKKAKKMKKESKNAQKKDKMTFGEALLAYQIRIKETTIEELLVEVKQIEEKNTRCTERNDRLKTEQLGHINALLKAAKAQEKELTKKEVVNREQVDLAMREKWDYFRKKEHLFEEIHSEINHLAKQTVEKLVEKDYWLGYKNVTSIEHVKQIQLLQAVIEDIKQNSTEINDDFFMPIP